MSSRYADLTVLYNNNNNDDDEEEKEERMASVLYGARIPFKTPFFLFPFSYINSQFSFAFLILTLTSLILIDKFSCAATHLMKNGSLVFCCCTYE